jgi:hypothetical protein
VNRRGRLANAPFHVQNRDCSHLVEVISHVLVRSGPPDIKTKGCALLEGFVTHKKNPLSGVTKLLSAGLGSSQLDGASDCSFSSNAFRLETV